LNQVHCEASPNIVNADTTRATFRFKAPASGDRVLAGLLDVLLNPFAIFVFRLTECSRSV